MGPKVRYALDFEHCYPMGFRAAQSPTPVQGHTIAKLLVVIKLPREHGDYDDYEASAEVARERFDWIDGNESSSEVQRRAADWMAESLARVLTAQWAQLNPPPPSMEKLKRYLEDTFSKLSSSDIQYALKDKSRAAHMLVARYKMSQEAAVAKIEEAYAFASQRE